jgi:hypothetical protein
MKATTKILLLTLDKMSDHTLRSTIEKILEDAVRDANFLSRDRTKRILRIAVEAAEIVLRAP